MSRLKKAGNSVHSDLTAVTTVSNKPKTEILDDKYHVTAAGRKFLVEQGQIFITTQFSILFYHTFTLLQLLFTAVQRLNIPAIYSRAWKM
jgi:hypothetical protein